MTLSVGHEGGPHDRTLEGSRGAPPPGPHPDVNGERERRRRPEPRRASETIFSLCVGLAVLVRGEFCLFGQFQKKPPRPPPRPRERPRLPPLPPIHLAMITCMSGLAREKATSIASKLGQLPPARPHPICASSQATRDASGLRTRTHSKGRARAHLVRKRDRGRPVRRLQLADVLEALCEPALASGSVVAPRRWLHAIVLTWRAHLPLREHADHSGPPGAAGTDWRHAHLDGAGRRAVGLYREFIGRRHWRAVRVWASIRKRCGDACSEAATVDTDAIVLLGDVRHSP